MLHNKAHKVIVTGLLGIVLLLTTIWMGTDYVAAAIKPTLTIDSKEIMARETTKVSVDGLDWAYSWKTEFSSENERVATVDSEGVVKGVTAGDAVIHAKVTQQGKTYYLELAVHVKAAYLDIVSSSYTVYEKGTITLKADTHGLKNIKLSWSSSNTKVGTIDNNGVFTAKKAGKTTILLKEKTSKETAQCTIEVKKPTVEIDNPLSSCFVGTTHTFTGTAGDIRNSRLEWSSSNTGVGTIDKKSGVFKALSKGTTNITLKEATTGATTECSIKVQTYEDLSDYLSFDNSKGYISKEIENNLRKVFNSTYKNICDYYNNGVVKKVTLIIDPNYGGIAATSGSTITFNPTWLQSNLEDYDAFTHELIHVAQSYGTMDNIWLIEGITDYGRDKFGINNEKAKWSLSAYQPGQHYTNGYTITAAFLVWIEDNFADNLVKELNQAIKSGTYNEDIWCDYTGYTLEGLWRMYKKAGTGELVTGVVAPDFTVQLSDGKTVKLSDYEGKLVLLDFWGTWSEASVDELAVYQGLHKKYGDKLVLLTISDNTSTTVEKFKKKQEYTFMTGIDIKDEVATLYRVKLWPTAILIDQQGRIGYINSLGISKDNNNIVTVIDTLLSE